MPVINEEQVFATKGAVVMSIATPLMRSGSIRLLVFALMGGSLGWAQSPEPGQNSVITQSNQRSSVMTHVMERLPRYGDRPVTVVTPKLGDGSEPVRLEPLVIYGEKPPKFTQSQLLTKKGFADLLRKRYHQSAYAGQEYKDEKRLQDMADIKRYTEDLRLAGDISGSRDIEKEYARLFMRGHHDWKIEAIDKNMNARYR